MKKLLGLFLGLLTVLQANAVPPPPEILPTKFPRELDGYDIGVAYSKFANDLEHKLPSLLQEKAVISGQNLGPRVTVYTDWRRNSFLLQYHKDCDVKCTWQITLYETESSVIKNLAEKYFDPQVVLTEVKNQGITPGKEQSYIPKFNSSVLGAILDQISSRTVDEKTCKSISKSLGELEGIRLPKIDLEGIGRDKQGEIIFSHASWFEIDFPVLEQKITRSGKIKISGYGPKSKAGEIWLNMHKHIKDCFN